MFLVNRNAEWFAVLVVVLSLLTQEQFGIQASPGAKLDSAKISVLFDITCRVVAEEFGLHDSADVRVPVTLNFDEEDKEVVGDETHGVFTIDLSRWDQAQFVTAVSRIALQHLLSRERKGRIVRENLRHANLAGPISVGALRPSAKHLSPRNDFAHTSPCAFSPAARCFCPFPISCRREDRQRSPAFCPPGAQFAP